ncbi:MAG: ABC transporter substrate-binding protein [Hyphomicrobiaceae bacterium]
MRSITKAQPVRVGAVVGLALAIAAGSTPVRAQGSLVLYCSVQEELCRAIVPAFEKATGIKVSMTRKSSGEVYAQIKAESANPKGDVWWGGTGDPHLQAAEEGLTEAHKSTKMSELHPWAAKAWEDAKGRTIGIYSGALGFGYNAKTLARRKLPEPKCWADLLKPEFKGEVQVADPNSSGTAYTLLATIIQLQGEAKGFDYLKQLHKNVNQYTKSGAAPAKATSLGETTIGIVFMHDMVAMAMQNPDVKTVAPCEGTGYEIGSMSIIKGARNLENAKKFYDFALTPAAQELGANHKQLQIPSNKSSKVPAQAPKMESIKLIDYDFKKYGSSAERKRLLAKWVAEVKNLPK